MALDAALRTLPLLAAALLPASETRPTVFAAASLAGALTEVVRAYEATTGISVVASYASSSTLARQIEHGAPADLFLSADLAWMDHLAGRKLIDPATRLDLLGNALVVIAPAGKGFAFILAGLVLAFARCLGEFGATITLAGSIPGESRTLPVAIWQSAQTPDGDAAVWRLVAISIVVSIAALVGSEWLARRLGARLGPA